MDPFSDRYEPQMTQQSMIGEINKNYQVARNFYARRREMFRQVLQRQAGLAIEQFQDSMRSAIVNSWNKNIYKIVEGIFVDKNATLDQKIEKIEDIFRDDSLKDEYINAIKTGNYVRFKGKMGFAFEEFVNDRAITPALKLGTKYANATIKNEVSGAFKSISSVTRGGAKNIRADEIIFFDGITFDRDTEDILRSSKNNLPLELTRTLTLEYDENEFPTFKNEWETSDGNIIKKFLTNQDFFGFSSKVYNSTEDNKHFSSSTTIRDLLNSVFYTPSQYTQRRHSWDINYANLYIIYNLSKIIITIISPTTIAMTYGDTMMWMDEFLSKKIFYMDVSYVTQIGKHEAGEGRVFPSIPSASIITKNYDIARGLSAINYSLVKKKNYFNNTTYTGIKLTLT